MISLPRRPSERWQESRDPQLTMSKGRAGGSTTRCSTLLGCQQSSDFLRSGTSAIRCLSRQKQTPDEWNCTKARGTAAHALRFGTLLKPGAPHPPPNVRAFITACREGDFPGPLVRRQRAPDAATELESVATFTTGLQQFSFPVHCLP